MGVVSTFLRRLNSTPSPSDFLSPISWLLGSSSRVAPFRARRDKTAFPRVNPGLYFFGPLGHRQSPKIFLRRPLSRNVQTAGAPQRLEGSARRFVGI
jgi:hypothetical protein